jgi:hypothetical protein
MRIADNEGIDSAELFTNAREFLRCGFACQLLGIEGDSKGAILAHWPIATGSLNRCRVSCPAEGHKSSRLERHGSDRVDVDGGPLGKESALIAWGATH